MDNNDIILENCAVTRLTLDTIFENSQDKDGDGSDGCLAETKEIITAQTLPVVEEEGSLGSGEDQAAVAELVQTQGLLEAGEEDIHYQFRSGEGTVTYRVVQVGGSGDAGDLSEIVSTTPSFSAAAGVSQAVLTSPINGPFYVIGSQDMFGAQSPRSLAPRTSRSSIQIETTRGSASPLQRDDRRRATHNEVERRRRDKINNWIIKLSKIIPDCSSESAKSGQSKGGILAKACEYISELRTTNQRLGESIKEKEHLIVEAEVLRQQNEELKRENSLLRSQLSQHGLLPSSSDLHNSVS